MSPERVLGTLINAWWQGIVLTAMIWLVLRDMPRLSAATRLAIWRLTLAVVVLLPVWQRLIWFAWTGGAAPRQTAPIAELALHDAAPLLAPAIFLAIVQLLRLAISYLSLRWLKRRADVADGIALPVETERLPAVLLSDRVTIPMAAGYREPAILLPRSMAALLRPAELRHVLLHECGHLLRRDDWSALGERLVRAIFAIQPAVHWIGRCIERERELACDDWVAAHTGDTTGYANALARVAELAPRRDRASWRDRWTRWTPALAPAAGRPKAIFSRMRSLLDRTRNRTPSVSEPAVVVAGLLILLSAAGAARLDGLIDVGNYNSRWVETTPGRRAEMRVRGELQYTPDDADVESMSPDGRLSVRETTSWRDRTIEIESDGRGGLTRRYHANGEERPFDDEARRFLSQLLRPWVREQGADIPGRVARLLRAGGANAVLDDIRHINSASVRRRSLEELLSRTRLPEWEMHRALDIAAKTQSDHERRQFLEHTRDRLTGPGMDARVLAVIDKMDSDHDRAHLLGLEIERDVADPAARSRLLRSVGRLHSDDAKSRLLRRAVRQWRTPPPAEFFDAADTLHSDEERARVALAALALEGANPAVVTRSLELARPLHSDREKANVLAAAAPRAKDNAEAFAEASRTLATMHSDSDRQRAIEALGAEATSATAQRELFRHTAAMGSDEAKSRLLLRAAHTFPEEDAARHAYFAAVDSIHSEDARRRVLIAVAARPSLHPESVREVTRSAVQLDRNGQSEVMKALAAR